MYKLTERRLEAAELILERYRAELIECGLFHAGSLERELRDVWSIGYQEIKDIMIDIVKRHERYHYIAIYYMEHSNSPGVVSEFKRTLADEYGIASYDHGERKAAQKEFWENALLELREQEA